MYTSISYNCQYSSPTACGSNMTLYAHSSGTIMVALYFLLTYSICVSSVLTISEPMVGDEGIYQCVGQEGLDGSTAIVSSSYVNIQCEDT